MEFVSNVYFEYSLETASEVSLEIYGMDGQQLKAMHKEHMNAGTFRLQWNAAELPDGFYIYQFHVMDGKGMETIQGKVVKAGN